MRALEHLTPQGVFRFFEDISAIPHGSGNTRAISDYCVSFANARGLEVHQDASNNVIIVKPAAPGYETAAPVILQGHLDMVCERAPACKKDMAREGLDLFVEGDLIGARDTTLGGDDGIAVAMMLALLDDAGARHPRLECVFTADEEVGMLGAAALDVSPLRGRRMLNLDSEAEGVFTVGCAGGNVTACTLPVSREPFDGVRLAVTVSGLLGGHSGTEIDKGRANADLLMGRLLSAAARQTALRLISAAGGTKDNAIPTACTAVVAAADEAAVRSAADALAAALREEYRVADPDAAITVAPCQAPLLPMDGPSTDRALCMLTCLPNGIQAMSFDVPGLVQTSLNLGILTTEPDRVTASFCVRSSLESQKAMLTDRLERLMAALGGRIAVSGDYPGWAYRPDSPLRDLLIRVYRAQTGQEPQIEAIHAGVECGLFAGKLPGLDCVSLGPDLTAIHTCRERMSISSVQRTWALVTEALSQMH